LVTNIHEFHAPGRVFVSPRLARREGRGDRDHEPVGMEIGS
jgi:hypothetical protein